MSCRYRIRYGSDCGNGFGGGIAAVDPNPMDMDQPLVKSPHLTPASSFKQPRNGSMRRRAASRSVVERSQSQVSARASSHLVDANPGKPRRSCDMPLRANPEDSNPSQLTLILMGAPMVGKSTLVNQFLWEIFLREYRPTVEEFNWIEYGNDKQQSFKSVPNENGKPTESSSDDADSSGLLLQIIDSSGSRDFLAMRYLYYKIGDAFMVVYSLNDPLSYAEALIMVREIQQRNSKNAPILLVANKSDMEPSEYAGKHMPPPSEILPQNVECVRICSKNLTEVKKAFYKLIEELARRRQLTAGKPGFQLHKRRQSMPSRRTANELGIDSETLERLVRKHDSHSRNNNCTIS
uniref:GTP-binding protein Rhes n=1 Tax=Ditylenchus dipsaci TaxID=166011 RepID=A0A915E1Y2_9BILA